MQSTGTTSVSRLAMAIWLTTFSVACRPEPRTLKTAVAPAPVPVLGDKIESPGLNNVVKIMDRFYSGGSPQGMAGFRSLSELGFRTIISVDGARPEIEVARRFGLRYVHIPLGYDGVPQEKAWLLAKAVRDLPGPVYLHCHHGKHRGPAAAATVRYCLDPNCSVDDAVAIMKESGADPRYSGLFAAPSLIRRPSFADLESMSSEFPAETPVPDLAKSMVEVSDRWDRIREIRKAGWKSPPNHRDVDPPHEMKQLVEQFREMARLPVVAGKYPPEFGRILSDSEAAAEALERELRPGLRSPSVPAAEAAYQRLANNCTECHGRYRDKPRSR